LLEEGRDELETGNIGAAIKNLSGLIGQNLFLEEIIRDLQEALYIHSEDTAIWETLGDAYLRNDQLQEALEAYNRAEELLR
jgi:DNA-binding SARP family transcriptional activator